MNDSVMVLADGADIPDSSRRIAFTRMETVETTPQVTAAARAREERASARSAPARSAGVSNGSTGRSVRNSNEGPELNLQRALDPQGRKHWRSMSRKSTRRSPNAPPGTVPVH